MISLQEDLDSHPLPTFTITSSLPPSHVALARMLTEESPALDLTQENIPPGGVTPELSHGHRLKWALGEAVAQAAEEVFLSALILRLGIVSLSLGLFC